jgi:hypothetical protein
MVSTQKEAVQRPDFTVHSPFDAGTRARAISAITTADFENVHLKQMTSVNSSTTSDAASSADACLRASRLGSSDAPIVTQPLSRQLMAVGRRRLGVLLDPLETPS